LRKQGRNHYNFLGVANDCMLSKRLHVEHPFPSSFEREKIMIVHVDSSTIHRIGSEDGSCHRQLHPHYLSSNTCRTPFSNPLVLARTCIVLEGLQTFHTRHNTFAQQLGLHSPAAEPDVRLSLLSSMPFFVAW
jgi:hypothetical protein